MVDIYSRLAFWAGKDLMCFHWIPLSQTHLRYLPHLGRLFRSLIFHDLPIAMDWGSIHISWGGGDVHIAWR